MEDKKRLHNQIENIIFRLNQKLVSFQPFEASPKSSDYTISPSIMFTNNSSTQGSRMTPPPKSDLSFTFKPSLKKKMPKKKVQKSPAKKPESPDLYTYTPKVNERSKEIDRQRTPRGNRWDNLYQLHAQKSAKREELVREAEASQENLDKQWSFKPNLLQKSPLSKNRERFLHHWGVQRDLKLALIQQQENDKQLQECTFSPRINPHINNNGTNLVMSSRGVEQFLERQRSARKEKTAPEQRENNLTYKDLSAQQFEEARKTLQKELQHLRIN